MLTPQAFEGLLGQASVVVRFKGEYVYLDELAAGQALVIVPTSLLTTYGVARTDSARLKAMAWRIVVVDEAQNLKNPAAAQTKAAPA